MDAVIIGPLALPAGTFVVLIGFLAATLTSLWWQRRGQHIEATLWRIAITAVLGARLAFLLRYHSQYESWRCRCWPSACTGSPLFAPRWCLPVPQHCSA